MLMVVLYENVDGKNPIYQSQWSQVNRGLTVEASIRNFVGIQKGDKVEDVLELYGAPDSTSMRYDKQWLGFGQKGELLLGASATARTG